MIRQFRRGDAQSCSRIIHACLEMDTSLSAALRDRIRAAESPQSIEERSRLFYLAVHETDARISGLAGLDMNEIRLLCVAPEQRRCGIGRALLRHIAAMVPRHFFSDIFVYSSIPAADFYKAHGFIEKGRVHFDFGADSLPTVFMALPIRQGNYPCPACK